MTNTILASTLGILWQILRAEEVDPDSLFREMGVDPVLITDSRTRVLEMTTRALWQRAIDAAGNDCLGIKAGLYWHPSQLGALGGAWLSSSTLRTGLERIARFLRMINDNLEVRLEETPAGFVYTPFFKTTAGKLSFEDDLHLSMLIEMCRTNYGRQLNPVAVNFTHPKPKCAGEYFTYFRSPVEFDAGKSSLILPMNVIDQPLMSDNPMLAELNDQMMIEYLVQLDQKQLTERVKALIIDQLPSGGACIQNTADLLTLSIRTLERRLKDEDSSFTTLLEEIRRDLAYKYLRKDTNNLMEITFLLGYSEESAFSRAFKRWSGQSPNDYRKTAISEALHNPAQLH